MADQDQYFVGIGHQGCESLEAFSLKQHIADRQRFVYHQDTRIDMN